MGMPNYYDEMFGMPNNLNDMLQMIDLSSNLQYANPGGGPMDEQWINDFLGGLDGGGAEPILIAGAPDQSNPFGIPNLPGDVGFDPNAWVQAYDQQIPGMEGAAALSNPDWGSIVNELFPDASKGSDVSNEDITAAIGGSDQGNSILDTIKNAGSKLLNAITGGSGSGGGFNLGGSGSSGQKPLSSDQAKAAQSGVNVFQAGITGTQLIKIVVVGGLLAWIFFGGKK